MESARKYLDELDQAIKEDRRKTEKAFTGKEESI